VDFGAACKTAKTPYAQVRLGHDPAGEKEQAKRTASETFEAVVSAQYLLHKRRELRPQSYEDVERPLLRPAKPLHRLRLETVSRRGPREQCDSPARRSMSDPNYLDGDKYIEDYLEIAKKKFERQQGRLADGDASMLADEQAIAGMAARRSHTSLRICH
jgi:hypothetical protein